MFVSHVLYRVPSLFLKIFLFLCVKFILKSSLMLMFCGDIIWYICNILEPKELVTFLETDKTCRKITLEYIDRTMVKSIYIYYESFPYVIKSRRLLRKHALQRELSLLEYKI